MELPEKNSFFGAERNASREAGSFKLGQKPGYGFDRQAIMRNQDKFGGIKRASAAGALGKANDTKEQGIAKDKSGSLQHRSSISVRQFVKDTIEEMNKGDFKKFKINTEKQKKEYALRLASKIEGKKVGLDSWVHRDKAVQFGKDVRAGKQSYGERKSCYSELQARKAVVKPIAKATGHAPTNKWANL